MFICKAELEGGEERSSICWLSTQMATVALSWARLKLEASLCLPHGCQGHKHLGYLPQLSQGHEQRDR